MSILLLVTFIFVVSTMGYGYAEMCKAEVGGKGKLKKVLRYNLSIFIPILCGVMILIVPDFVKAAETAGELSNGAGLGYIGAALSTGLATIGSGYAVGCAASAALGAVSEDPKILGKTLIYVGLGEGIAIYGLIISIMILSKL
jgi:V/A-type H+/Na+-transporting ATPase subunit K